MEWMIKSSHSISILKVILSIEIECELFIIHSMSCFSQHHYLVNMTVWNVVCKVSSNFRSDSFSKSVQSEISELVPSLKVQVGVHPCTTEFLRTISGITWTQRKWKVQNFHQLRNRNSTSEDQDDSVTSLESGSSGGSHQ